MLQEVKVFHLHQVQDADDGIQCVDLAGVIVAAPLPIESHVLNQILFDLLELVEHVAARVGGGLAHDVVDFDVAWKKLL
jgi:hypothetical protein